MNSCEMCGKLDELVTADVEGVEMKICSGCSTYGSVKKTVSNHVFRPQRRINDKEPQVKIISNYASLLKSSREKKGLSQEEFALFLQEKVSAVATWEQGRIQPSLDVARKVGKLLNLSLIKAETAEAFESKKDKRSDVVTLGDFIKKRK